MAVGIAGSPGLRALLQPAPETIDWLAWEQSQAGEPDGAAIPLASADALPIMPEPPEAAAPSAEEPQPTRSAAVAQASPELVEQPELVEARVGSAAPAEPSLPGGVGVQLAPSGRCGFTVNDLEVGRSVRRRQVVGSASPFESNGAPVFVWFDVTNRDRDLDTATVRWSHAESGHTVEEEVAIRVGSHWRFYVQQVLPPLMLGNWRIELVDGSDCVVGSAGIEMIPLGWAEEGG